MYDYVWILNIPSEVTGAFSRFDLTNLPPSRKRIFSSSEQSKDQGVTITTCSIIGDVHDLIFNVDNGQLTRKVTVDVMDSGLCRINIESGDDLNDAVRSDILLAVSSMIALFIGGTSRVRGMIRFLEQQIFPAYMVRSRQKTIMMP